MLRLKKRIKGLAITTILLAVVLLAAIAVTIAMSSRAGNASSSQQQDKLLATTIINQAQQMKTGIEWAMSNGVDITTISSVNHNPLVTSFSPASAGIAAQTAPANASPSPGNLSWVFHGAGSLVKLMNIGTGAGNYVLELDPLTQQVCQQINLALFNDPTIPTLDGSETGWPGYMTVDASTDVAVNSKMEGCFYSAALSRYLYYHVVLVQ